MNDNQNEQIDYNQQNSYKENKKRKKKQILIISIIIVLIIILLIIILLFFNNGKETSDEKYTEPYHGKWKCNENIELEINSKGFVMDYGDKGYIEATYIVDSIKKESKYNKYILNVSATKRIIDGEEKKGDYTTQYEIVIDESNNSEMAMANTITSSMYICYKNNSQK